MEIILTNLAQQKLQSLELSGNGYLKLVYDSEDCGCALDGIPQLWLVNEPAEQDRGFTNSPIPFIYDSHSELFFEPQLKLDYRHDKQSYVLSSHSQIYNSNIIILDKR